MKERGKRHRILVLLPLALLLLAGCGTDGADSSPEQEPDYRVLVDDFSVIALQKDRENLRFERALALAGEYLAGNSGAHETDEALEEIYMETMAEYTALEQIEISPELEGIMTEYGIDPADYSAMADERIDNLYSDGQDLYTLCSYVLAEEKDILSWWLDMKRQFLELQVEYDAWAVNYMFCNWTGEELDYVNEKITDRLDPEHRPEEWLTDRDEIERRVSDCLDRWDECTWEFARYVESEELAPAGR